MGFPQLYIYVQIGLSWDDAKIRQCTWKKAVILISHICYARKSLSILGTSDGVAVLAEKLGKIRDG